MNNATSTKKIAFLYNHEASHQIPHTATIIGALAAAPATQVDAWVASESQHQLLRRLIGDSERRIRIRCMEIHWGIRWLLRLLDNIAPASRIYRLWRLSPILAEYDALVSPETTCTMLRSVFGNSKPALIWVPHGAGDRAVGFSPEIRWFDLVLVAGDKIRSRMIALGLVTPERCHIIGYPKFDAVHR